MLKKSYVIVVPFIITIITILQQNCANPNGPKGSSNQSSLSPATPDQYKAKEIIVKMSSDGVNSTFKTWALSYGLVLENEWAMNRTTHWSWTASLGVQDVQNLLAEKFPQGVVFSEPNYLFSLPPNSVLNTSSTLLYADVQNILASLPVGSYGQTSAPIDAVAARAQLTSTNGPIIVAVIDSGLDMQHALFANTGAMWTNTKEIPGNGIDDDGNGYVDDIHGWDFANKTNSPNDDNGHGTHCAGIVLGTGLDIFQIPLPAPKVQIMPLKFLTSTGSGATSDALNAVYYAVNNGARVISNSWGGSAYSYALDDAIAYAYEKNVAFVAAAGNSSANNDTTPEYPADYKAPNVLSIAATTSSDALASFSNFGPTSVNLAAPGVQILSSYPINKYAYLSGTSMATPFVAGTVALMMHERPEITGYEAKEIILKNSDTINLGGNVVMNKRLNVLTAVTGAKTSVLSGNHPAYTPGNGGGDPNNPSAGCGLVKSINSDGPSGTPPAALLLLLMMPMMLAIICRSRKYRHSY